MKIRNGISSAGDATDSINYIEKKNVEIKQIKHEVWIKWAHQLR